jgi:hypothetical protein
MVRLDQPYERGLVAPAQRLDEAAILGGRYEAWLVEFDVS